MAVILSGLPVVRGRDRHSFSASPPSVVGSRRAMTQGRATGAVPHPLALLTSSYSRLIRGLSPRREEADGYYGASQTIFG